MVLPAHIRGQDGPQHGAEVALVPLHRRAAARQFLGIGVRSAGDIAPDRHVLHVLPQHQEVIGPAVLRVGDGEALHHGPRLGVIGPGVEAVGQHRGLPVVEVHGHPEGWIGHACRLVRLRAVGIREAVDNDGDVVHRRSRTQSVFQIAAVGEEVPVVLPAGGLAEVGAALGVVCPPDSGKAAGICSYPEDGLQGLPLRRQRRLQLLEVVEWCGEGVAHRHRPVL